MRESVAQQPFVSTCSADVPPQQCIMDTRYVPDRSANLFLTATPLASTSLMILLRKVLRELQVWTDGKYLQVFEQGRSIQFAAENILFKFD